MLSYHGQRVQQRPGEEDDDEEKDAGEKGVQLRLRSGHLADGRSRQSRSERIDWEKRGDRAGDSKRIEFLKAVDGKIMNNPMRCRG